MAYIAGAFTGTYGGTTIGEASDGFTIEWFMNKRLITGDRFGQAPQDAVLRGMEMFISFTLNEYSAMGVAGLIWPYHGTLGNSGTTGALDSDIVDSLVLTPVSGTSADTLEGAWTFPFSVIAEGFPTSIKLAPDLREIPLRLRVYPSSSGIFFTQA